MCASFDDVAVDFAASMMMIDAASSSHGAARLHKTPTLIAE